jgi:ribonuclease VapC
MADKPALYVLDSYAILAYLEGEPGADLVADLLRRTVQEAVLFMSLINFGEIAYIAERERGTQQAKAILQDIRRLPILLGGVNEQRVLAAAHIKAHYPLSYADAFAVALAQELDATVVTGDPEFKTVESLVPVLWLP